MIGQQLDVGEPVGEAVIGERVGELVVASGSAGRRRACGPTTRGAPRRSTSERRAPTVPAAACHPLARRPTRRRGRRSRESIDGGRWWAAPTGSDLSTRSPVGGRDPVPVRRADPAPATQPHHTPDESSGSSVLAVQPSKSPTTCTAPAAGAHTANQVPPSSGWAPNRRGGGACPRRTGAGRGRPADPALVAGSSSVPSPSAQRAGGTHVGVGERLRRRPAQPPPPDRRQHLAGDVVRRDLAERSSRSATTR